MMPMEKLSKLVDEKINFEIINGLGRDGIRWVIYCDNRPIAMGKETWMEPAIIDLYSAAAEAFPERFK